MPWLAIAYEDVASRKHLTEYYGVKGIPTLIILNADGSVITEDGRGEINDDPYGQVLVLIIFSIFSFILKYN